MGSNAAWVQPKLSLIQPIREAELGYGANADSDFNPAQGTS